MAEFRRSVWSERKSSWDSRRSTWSSRKSSAQGTVAAHWSSTRSLAETTSRHDLRIAAALGEGVIRLLSADWLRSRDEIGFVLSRMQDLPAEAFVTCAQARSFFEAYDRRVGALSYGWLSKLHSDPHGLNTAHVLQFLRYDAGMHIEAL